MSLDLIIHAALFGSFLSPLLCTVVLAIKAIAKKPSNEATIATITQTSFVSYLICTLVASVGWFLFGHQPIKWDLGMLYHKGRDALSISLYLDAAGAVFLITCSIIANVIIFYSRRYLHRDPGYRRFFMVLSLFVFGLTLVICAGSFDLIFAGWEIVGFSSFLLIGFYWHRSQAAINANRAYIIYRICDLGFLASALISHLLWHSDNLFFEMSSGHLSSSWAHIPLWQQWLLSSVILLPVIGKSAQFPLCYWLPKAMEGPTPSSAIFYGSLSIHAGVFLLIRTFSIWHHTPGFVWVLGTLGIITAVFATLCGRVQANIKGQVGYASIAQVGIMLVELAFGLHMLALIHMVGNAFLRCFQLLVSSSILTQQLQIHSALEGETLNNLWAVDHQLPSHSRDTLYVFALNEGYIQTLFKKGIVEPFLKVARHTNAAHETLEKLFRRQKTRSTNETASVSLQSIVIIPAVFLTITLINHFLQEVSCLPYVLLVLTLFLSFSALGEQNKPLRTLHSAALSNVLAVFSLWLHHPKYHAVALFYLIGFATSWVIAADTLGFISKRRRLGSLRVFSGFYAQFPLGSAIFLVGILGIIGFPICSTFFGEDLLIQYAVATGWEFLAVFNLVFVLNGISLVRLYSHLFWGTRDNHVADVDFDFSRNQAIFRVALFLMGNCLAFLL